MGTSTCDMLVAPGSEIGTKVIRGICGQVDGSIIPGMVGMEAGQSAFGDIYAWFRRLLLWPVENILQTLQLNESEQKACSESIAEKLIPRLSEEALLLPPGGSGELALDWLNGRRTPDADQTLRGVIAGLNLGSDAPGLFRALVESTAFGAKKIVDRFIDEGVRIDGVIALGGIAGKSPFVMQTVCDALGIPVRIVKSKQACALGAAMFAAVAAGIFPNIEAAQETMGSGFEKEYLPDSKRKEIYGKLYADYCALAEMMENRNRRHISDVTLEMNG
jgi:L-ribulokinase